MKKSHIIVLSAGLNLAFAAPSHSWAQGYTVESVSDGGSIRGSVVYAGQPLARRPLPVTEDVEVCGTTEKYSSELIVNAANRGLQNVVVSIKEISKGKAWVLPEEGASLDQKGCSFSPHVLIVPAGETFNVLNNDGILHNLHMHAHENRSINKAQPKFLTTLKMKFPLAEFIKVTCDVHSWMEGWIVVADHPYYAVSDENGAFRIGDVPPGSYVLEFWHEKLGVQTLPIEITGGETVQADMTFEAQE